MIATIEIFGFPRFILDIFLNLNKGGGSPPDPVKPPPPAPVNVSDMGGKARQSEYNKMKRKRGRSSTILAGVLGGGTKDNSNKGGVLG